MLHINNSQKAEWMSDLNYVKYRCSLLKSNTDSESVLSRLYDIESKADMLILEINNQKPSSELKIALSVERILDDLNNTVVMCGV